MNSTEAVVSGNISFEEARQKVNQAKASIRDSQWIKNLRSGEIQQAKTPRQQAALLLKVINDVAKVLNFKVKEQSNAEAYPYELSDYEISEQEVQTIATATKDLITISQANPRQALELTDKINAHNPNTLPEAKVERDPDIDLSFPLDSENGYPPVY